MSKDKMLDELFSSAKKQDSLLNDSEIISLLENSDVPIVKTYFGVKKMNLIYYTAAAVVLGYFAFVNLLEQEANTNLSDPVIKHVNELPQASKYLEEPIQTSNPNEVIEKRNKFENSNITNKDLVKFENKKDDKVGNNSYKVKSEKVELVFNKINDNKVKEKPSKLIDYIATNVINLNTKELKKLGVIITGNKLKFSFDEKDDKAMVVTLLTNASFNIDGGKPLNSITPKFVSGKNGNKIMSFFDDKNTLAYRTSKVLNEGERHVTTVLKRNAEEDYLDIKLDVDKNKTIRSYKDSIIIYDPITLDKMLINKLDPDIDREMVLEIQEYSEVLPNSVSENGKSSTFTFNEENTFIDEAKSNLQSMPNNINNLNIEHFINDNSVTYSFEDDYIKINDNLNSDSSNHYKQKVKRLDHVNLEGVKNKFLIPDEDGDLVWKEKEPNANFVMLKKTSIDGKTTETRIENKNVKLIEKEINIDSILKKNNIIFENLQEKIDKKMVVIQRNIDESDKKLNDANAKVLNAHLKSKAIQENVENYFNHDINKLIPIEIKLDGENLDYVLWFEPTLELLSKLPEHLQEKLRSEFEVLQNSESAVCGEAPVKDPISDRWNGCSGAIMNLKLYPIPAKDNLNYSFELSEARSVEITFTDINGNKLDMNSRKQSFSAGNYNNNLNISNLTPGIYYLTIVSDKGEIVNQRFIKE